MPFAKNTHGQSEISLGLLRETKGCFSVRSGSYFKNTITLYALSGCLKCAPSLNIIQIATRARIDPKTGSIRLAYRESDWRANLQRSSKSKKSATIAQCEDRRDGQHMMPNLSKPPLLRPLLTSQTPKLPVEFTGRQRHWRARQDE